jgi:hypothetical protein
VDYMRWLAAEVTCLPEVFAGVNENFISTAVEGVLVMAGGSVDLAAMQASTADSGVDVLPGEQDVWNTAFAITSKWWRSFGYKSTLVLIKAKLC